MLKRKALSVRNAAVCIFVIWLCTGLLLPSNNADARTSLTDLQNQINEQGAQIEVEVKPGGRNINPGDRVVVKGNESLWSKEPSEVKKGLLPPVPSPVSITNWDQM